MDSVTKPAADQTFNDGAAKYFSAVRVHVGFLQQSSTAATAEGHQHTQPHEISCRNADGSLHGYIPYGTL